MKPIILIIILIAIGTWVMQALNDPNMSLQSANKEEWAPLIPSSVELLRWQW